MKEGGIVSTIKAQVKSFVIDNFLMGRRADDLADATSFLERSILDSTGFLELIAFLEDRFGIQVADEEMIPANLDSLNAIESYLRRKLPADALLAKSRA
jgi:acyl carrier protein